MIAACPEKYLLWFHHVRDHRTQSGRTLWGELQNRFSEGVAFVEKMLSTWQSLSAKIDSQRYKHVSERLTQQLENTHLWREICLNYFSQFVSSDDL